MADVYTVIWKEWKELLLQRGGMRGGALGLLSIVGVFGVFLPLQMGRGWVQSPNVLALWAWVPLFLVTNVIADSFAGERERHTLETLLASHLSDRAILFGKVAAAVGYGWGITLASLVLGLVTVNLAHGRGGVLMYSPVFGLGIVGFSALTSLLVAGAGVLISLRTATVRQAQQTLSIGIMLLLFVPIAGVQALPMEWKTQLAQAIAATDVATLGLGAGAVLVVLDIAFLGIAMSRFQRSRLIVD